VAYRHESPLAELVDAFDPGHDIRRVGPAHLMVANPEAARAIFANRAGDYVDTSDFFVTRRGVFGPRAAQVAIGRAGRDLLRRHLDRRRGDLPGLVRDRLAPASSWPDAGNLLVLEHLRGVLLRADAPADLYAIVDGIVRRAVLAGARQRHSALARIRFRRRAMRAIGREVVARRRAGVGEPRDLLDVVVSGGGSAAVVSELVEAYLSFLFATVGSIGFALGWAVLLAGTHPETVGDEPGWIVREALRLWPVAWMFERRPARATRLAGHAADRTDRVQVCTYLVHRHPRYWESANDFVPGRWASPDPTPAYVPFGHGPHSCTGAAVVLALLEDLVRVLMRDWRLSVTDVGAGPHLGPALAPPRFRVELRSKTGEPERR
jgi:hypothetical protein